MDPSQVPKLSQTVRSATLRAEQHILPVIDLPLLLEAVESGEWPTPDGTISYRRGEFDAGPPRSYDQSNFHFHSLDFRHVHPDFGWAGHVLHASGDSCSMIVQRVTESWQGLEATAGHQPRPFERLDDLVRHVTEVRADTMRNQATFEVFAPMRSGWSRSRPSWKMAPCISFWRRDLPRRPQLAPSGSCQSRAGVSAEGRDPAGA